jgi:hypothetical protein
MDTTMFDLIPKIKTKLHIVMIIDNSYVFDAKATADLKEQFTFLDTVIFQKAYREYVHIDFIHFEGGEVKTFNNQSKGSLVDLLDHPGLPKFGPALEIALRQLDEVIQAKSPIKPWLFMLHHGYKIGDIGWDKLVKLVTEKRIFYRGFILNDSIKINAILDGVTPLPFAKVKAGKMNDMFSFIFRLAQQRVNSPEDQGVTLPTREAIALWSEVPNK